MVCLWGPATDVNGGMSACNILLVSRRHTQKNSHIIVVLDADGATREFTTSEGATNAWAPDAQATAITADFILRKVG